MYRTNLCGKIDSTFLDKTIKLAGFVRKKRNHGNVVFIDLHDASGVFQCIFEKNKPIFENIDKLSLESVISVEGVVIKRSDENINTKIQTGNLELLVTKIEILSNAKELPFALHQKDLNEELQLKYRFLYLRKDEMQEVLKLRTNVIDFLRSQMKGLGFQEIQTPLLSSSSPEGARDYIVPSRLKLGKFFALPQAPQQFKQLLMASGVEKYFQIAPCFRDEDSRADRLLGEFYQLDFECAYACESDILNILETVIYNTFKNFQPNAPMNKKFPIISYDDAIKNYGTDKPDLRNPLKLFDITNLQELPNIFKNLQNPKLLTISAKFENASNSTMQKLTKQIQEFGAKGLAYCELINGTWSGPLAKMLPEATLKQALQNENDNFIFLVAATKDEAYKIASKLRTILAQELKLIDENEYNFCFINDFPMFEMQNNKWEFMHNPFSMPKSLDCSIEEIKSIQYDLVCNGYEITSGAVRNHNLELIQKVFKLINDDSNLEERFPLFKAFSYGIPPHAGAAPGIDRIIMLIGKKENVRDIVAFPMNQSGENLLMNAPSEIDETFLKDLRIKVLKEEEEI